MVCLTEKPNFCEASCCSVEVIKGGLGERFEGFFSKVCWCQILQFHIIFLVGFLLCFKKATKKW
jgi:hypothetical protein